MILSRRKFLLTATGALAATRTNASRIPLNYSREANPALINLVGDSGRTSIIDRKALVDCHSPIFHKLDPSSPLSIGNGEFAFTADVTGLQTFPREYQKSMPLCTMSHWGWHTSPLPAGLDLKQFRLTQYDTHGRPVGYTTSSKGQLDLYNWLRENPHRLHLGQIGLRLLRNDGGEAQSSDVAQIEQKLDLWAGTLTSRLEFQGRPVVVKTSIHPQLDLLAVKIQSPWAGEGQLSVRFAFPYGSPEMNAGDWSKPERHRSTMIAQSRNSAQLYRKFETDEYHVAISWKDRALFTNEKDHEFTLKPDSSQQQMEFVIAFSPTDRLRTSTDLPSADATFSSSARHWARFWSEGGAIDLSGSGDPRARELERRIVLSQYLTAIQCAGATPPQETGLTCNSWYGKFHLEMHWWHAAHFALWNRLPLLEKSLGWYASILPSARERARSQGYRGARWPKMVGPEARDSPSPIGPLLIWQQPHPIFYAELCHRSHPNRATLVRYRDIVFESAEFMASYAYFESTKQRYVLGPPVIPAQENHPARETWNPTFELAYWSFGLQTAQRWRERLGMKRNSEWDRIIANLSALPVRDGVYLAHENCPRTFTERNYDHPSMLGALGMLPGDRVDHETMRRTLKRVMTDWQWDKTWGWDYPVTAMTAARLGETKIAIDALMMNTEKNRYLANGHNWQRANLPCYLPGNGGLLYAVAMMAGGWSGAPRKPAPGFPDDGSWKVRAENLISRSLT